MTYADGCNVPQSVEVRRSMPSGSLFFRKIVCAVKNCFAAERYFTLGFLPVRNSIDLSTELRMCSISGLCRLPALR